MTDDSEEIFRRAAENYPLKTDSHDWETVLKKMQEKHVPEANREPQGKKKKSRWLLLLLILIPASVIEHNYKHEAIHIRQAASGKPIHNGVFTADNKISNRHDFADKPKANTAVADTGNEAIISNDQAKPVSNNKTVTGNLTNKPATLKVPLPPMESINTAIHPEINNAGKQSVAVQNVHTASSYQATGNDNLPQPTFVKNSKIKRDNNHNAKIENNIPEHRIKKFVSKQKTHVSIIRAESTSDGNNATATNEISKTATEEQGRVDIQPTEEAGSVTANEYTPKIAAAEIATTALVDSTKATSETGIKKEQKKKQKQKHWYAGLVAGPDFSTIKFQPVKKTGLNFGLIAGYTFNNKISIESGFLKDKKLYSSQGKYFSTKNIPVYANSTIEYVSGECDMYEVPLNINYTFSTKNRSTWFGTAGVSAYFMRKEAYVFDVRSYNTMYPYAADYKNHDNKFLAVINLSAGYVYHFGSILNLRIQPYFKIPVNKIGTGELPIQSAGVLVGITKNLF